MHKCNGFFLYTPKSFTKHDLCSKKIFLFQKSKEIERFMCIENKYRLLMICITWAEASDVQKSILEKKLKIFVFLWSILCYHLVGVVNIFKIISSRRTIWRNFNERIINRKDETKFTEKYIFCNTIFILNVSLLKLV